MINLSFPLPFSQSSKGGSTPNTFNPYLSKALTKFFVGILLGADVVSYLEAARLALRILKLLRKRR